MYGLYIARTGRIAFRPKNDPCHSQKRPVDPSERLTMTDPAPKFTSMGYFPKRSSAPPQRQVTLVENLNAYAVFCWTSFPLLSRPCNPVWRPCLFWFLPEVRCWLVDTRYIGTAMVYDRVLLYSCCIPFFLLTIQEYGLVQDSFTKKTRVFFLGGL